MNRIIRHITLVVSLIVAVLWSVDSNATHIVGGEIFYKWNADNDLEIYLEVLRDCNGLPTAPFDTVAWISVFDRNPNGTSPKVTRFNFGRFLRYGGEGFFGMRLDTIIEYEGNDDCFDDSRDACVTIGIYKVVLPFSSNSSFMLRPDPNYDGFIFAYGRCCRNAILDNIQTRPTQTGMLIKAEMSEEAFNEMNDQPDWPFMPPLYLCQGQDTVLDFSAQDEEGNRIEYSLFTPFEIGDSTNQFFNQGPSRFQINEPLSWRTVPSFGLDNLFGPGSSTSIDPVTGQLSITTAFPGTFLIGLKICEYDSDNNLISCRTQEFQITVRVCVEAQADAEFEFDENPCDNPTFEVTFRNLSSGTGGLTSTWFFDYPDSSKTLVTNDSVFTYKYDTTGEYKVLLHVVDSFGCEDTFSTIVPIYNSEFNFNYTAEETCGSPAYVILCDSSSGTYPITYRRWRIEIGNRVYEDSTASPKDSIFIDTSGIAIITLQVIDSVGCDSMIMDTVELEFTRADFEVGRDSCDNGFEVPFINTSTNATDYLWYFNYPDTADTSTLEDPEFTYPDVGRYQVMLIAYKDSSCTDTIIKTVTILDPQLMPDFEATSSCQDSLVLFLSDSSSSRYPIVSWDWSINLNGNFYSASGKDTIVRVDEEGTAIITLKITDSVGCMAMVMDTVELNFIDVRFISDTITICQGDSTRLIENPDSTLTYEWKPETGLNLTTPWDPWASPDTTTLYTLCVSDSVCTVIIDVLVIVEPTQEVEIQGDTSSCDGKFTLVAVSPDTDKFEWSDDPNFSNIIGTGDTIMVMVDDSATIYVRSGMPGNCRSIDSIKVYNRAICLDYQAEYNICLDEMIMINIVNCKPEQDLFVRWDDNDIILTSRDSLSIKIMPQDTGRYRLSFMVANIYGCILRDTIAINVARKPDTIDFITEIECDNPVVKFTATGDPVMTYRWDFGDGETGTGGPMIEHTYDRNGVYTVKLTAGNEGCDTMITKDITVVFFDCPSDSLILLCGGGMVELNPNGNPSYVYRWSPGEYLDDSTAVNPKAMVDQSVTFRVIMMDSTLLPDCKDTCYVDLAVPPSIDIDIMGDTLLCNEDSTTLTAVISNPNADVSWCDEDGNVIDTTLTITVFPELGTTCYTFKAIDNLGCSSEETVCVTRCLLDYDIMATDTICEGDTAIVMITNMDLDTLILNGEVLAPGEKVTFTYTPDSTTTYQYELLNECCMDTIQVTINVNQIDVVANADPRILPRGCPAQLTATFNPDWIYEWTPDDGTLSETDIHDPTAMPDETTIYQVKVTDMNGCMATDTVLVTVVPAECNETFVFLPNAFSPNDDGVNDILFVRSLIVEDMELVIYNRYGQRVFRTTSQAQGWDGTFNGEKLRPDVFSFYLWVRCKGQEEFTKKGNVTLLK